MNKKWRDNNLAMHRGKVLANKVSDDVIECELCGYAHKIPLPELKEWGEFYESDFYELDEKSNYLEETEQDKEYREYLHEDKFLNISLLKNINIPQSLLDIGSGSGLLLEYFQKKGWEVQGIEPSKNAYRYALERSRPTLNVPIEKYLSEDFETRYDVVHLREVLDSILNPLDIIKSIKEKCLKKDGILIVDTSNDFNEFQKCVHLALGERVWWVDGDTINFFNVQSIKQLLMKAGFTVNHQEATFPLEIFALMGSNYIDNPQIGHDIHQKRVLFERNLKIADMMQLKRRLYTALADIGLGRNVVTYASPKN